MYLLLPIATLGLRMTLTHESKESVRDINSLAEAFYPEGKWRPLVRRLVTAIHYLQGTSIPALQDYKFVRGLDEFTFTDVEKADKILQSVQTKYVYSVFCFDSGCYNLSRGRINRSR
ncbi:hypothetical protein FB451DRAFT_1232709 [Mycena latifolia]|nr:hypothetical protein FB451DRAFT_1232709 [Mycena latifolia]